MDFVASGDVVRACSPSGRLLDLVAGSKPVVVFTGAGISKESGLETFRDASGLWAGVDPATVATPEAFARDPVGVWRFYDTRRKLAAAAQPNPAHRALAALEATGRPFFLATQNVDGLHERAGSRAMVRLHGSLWRLRCTGCRSETDDTRIPLDPLPPRCACGAILRPAVVWFGELLPSGAFAAAERAARTASLCLVVGTSALVYPAASLPEAALAAGGVVVEINTEPTPLTPHVHEALRGPAGEVLPALLRAAGIPFEDAA